MVKLQGVSRGRTRRVRVRLGSGADDTRLTVRLIVSPGCIQARVQAVRAEDACPDTILERGFKHFLGDLTEKHRVFDREHQFHAPVQVAAHQVGAAQEELRVSAVFEEKDTAVFQKPADDTDDADIVADAFDARSQAADAANDQVDGDARLGGCVQKLDHPGVGEGIHLEDEPCGASGAGMGDLPFDECGDACPQVHRRHRPACGRRQSWSSRSGN